jgi:hypothetical protein
LHKALSLKVLSLKALSLKALSLKALLLKGMSLNILPSVLSDELVEPAALQCSKFLKRIIILFHNANFITFFGF